MHLLHFNIPPSSIWNLVMLYSRSILFSHVLTALYLPTALFSYFLSFFPSVVCRVKSAITPPAVVVPGADVIVGENNPVVNKGVEDMRAAERPLWERGWSIRRDRRRRACWDGAFLCKWTTIKHRACYTQNITRELRSQVINSPDGLTHPPSTISSRHPRVECDV